MKFLTLLLPLLLVAQISHGKVLTIQNGAKKIEGVAIAKSASLTLENSTNGALTLDFVGAGLRTKKVTIFNVNVYVAQIFVDNVGKLNRDEDSAIKSIKEMKAGAINLTFLRNVDASTVQVSFRDALEANNVNVNNPGIATFLAAVNDGANAEDGKSMNISLSKAEDGTVTVVYENTKGHEKIVKGDEVLFNGIFSIWLGESADKGLKTLKSAILKGDN